MNLIFSADSKWGIGKDNDLLFRTPGDMAFFRKMTVGKVVIMGRRTLESLPGGKPLPRRENIVLTRSRTFAQDGVRVCRSLPELFDSLAAYSDDDLFVIGGSAVYRQLLPYCRRAYVTRWEACGDADCSVPALDSLDGWYLLERSQQQEEQQIRYYFCIYAQRAPQPWRP